MDTTNQEYHTIQQDRNRIVTYIQAEITRCLRDKFPGYDHDVALYNDLLRHIDPALAYNIEYDGKDAKINEKSHLWRVK